ncbi:MAG: hypothetical protein V2B13_08465 [Pseudomonadota bacterium]
MTLAIDFNDIVRATLEEDCGNEGYIGLSPDGFQYHVVVPVDRQIARGLKAGHHPLDKTPFGGYKDWPYFCCLGYARPAKYDEAETKKLRLRQAGINAILLKSWAEQIKIPLAVKNCPTTKGEGS